MRRALSAFAGLVGALTLALAVLPANAASPPTKVAPPVPQTHECDKVGVCIHVTGPWVAVPANGEVTFLLECPKRGGAVGGSDARASSAAVRVWFDAQFGSPVSLGVTTHAFLLWHAVSLNGKPGSFQPLIGCVPGKQRSPPPSTLSARVVPAGKDPGVSLEPRAKNLVVLPGEQQTGKESCMPHERLIGSWDSIAFIQTGPPDLQYVSMITRNLKVVANSRVVDAIHSDPSLPISGTVVQVGAVCAP